MNRHFVLAAAMILGSVGLAHGAPRATYKWTDPSLQGKTWQVPAAASVSHVIYLNNCAGGCTMHPGYDNSLTNTSSIPNGTANISQYSGSASQWQQIVQCVRATYAPFNVQVVDTRPASGDYHMAIVAGRASEAGQGSGTLGVSPFSCGYIGNAISFSFANEDPTNINDICWTVSQETAHSWGLDHKFDNRDPMTYLGSGPAVKSFQNAAGACGEYSSRTCGCNYQGTGNSGENTFALVMATFGSSTPDTTPPTVTITAPGSNASVMPGFAVRADIADDVALAKAELRIDGTMHGTLMAAPWVWNAPTALSQGSHHVEITAYDLAGNTTKTAVDVVYGQACTDGGCTDTTQVCVDGHCVAGPDTTGGLGTACTDNNMCASGQCGDDGAGSKFCTAACDPAKAGCPSGFGCVDTGGGAGVCWPGADNGGGGCSSSGGSTGAVLASLAFGAMLITRRRRPTTIGKS